MTYIYVYVLFIFLNILFSSFAPPLAMILVNVSNLIVKRTLKMEGKNPQKMKGPKNSNTISKKPTTQQNYEMCEMRMKVWKSSDCQPSQEEKGTTRFWCSNLSQHQFCMPSFVDFLCHSFLCFASTNATATLYL
jgi:hypothetical protein